MRLLRRSLAVTCAPGRVRLQDCLLLDEASCTSDTRCQVLKPLCYKDPCAGSNDPCCGLPISDCNEGSLNATVRPHAGHDDGMMLRALASI